MVLQNGSSKWYFKMYLKMVLQNGTLKWYLKGYLKKVLQNVQRRAIGLQLRCIAECGGMACEERLMNVWLTTPETRRLLAWWKLKKM